MKNLTRTTRYILYAMLFIAVLAAIIGLVVNIFYPFTTALAWILGLLLGTLSSAVRMVLLERSTKNAMQKDTNSAKNYAQAQFLLRFIITIAVLVIIFLFQKIFNPIAGVIGILSLQLGAYIAKWMLKRKGYPED